MRERRLTSIQHLDNLKQVTYISIKYFSVYSKPAFRPNNGDFARNVAASPIAKLPFRSAATTRGLFARSAAFRERGPAVSKCRFEFPRGTVKYIGTRAHVNYAAMPHDRRIPARRAIANPRVDSHSRTRRGT